MRKILIATALASSALAGSAYADDTGPYITIEGGAVAQRHVSISDGAGYEQTDAFKHGWEAGGAVGYDFGHFRLEAEAFHDNSVLKSQNRPTGTTPPNGYYDQSSGLYGRTRTNAIMGNVLLGLGHWGGVKVYAGGGAGYADTFLFDNLASSGIISGHDHGFAWQGIAGLTVPVSHSVDLGVKYRYFDPSGANQFGYSDGTTREGTLRSHSLLATLTFNFGSHTAPAPEVAMAPPPPPPPAPPPPPPPPPPVAAPVCNNGPYIVFFDWDKSAISPEAANILDSAIQAYGNCGTVPITLAGYTDSSGSVRYNLGLAARRDEAVQAYLTGHGIAATSISSHAYGKANQRVPTADGVRELQNRRVEITYGTGAGA